MTTLCNSDKKNRQGFAGKVAHTSLRSVFGSLRQQDPEFEARLSNIVRCHLGKSNRERGRLEIKNLT